MRRYGTRGEKLTWCWRSSKVTLPVQREVEDKDGQERDSDFCSIQEVSLYGAQRGKAVVQNKYDGDVEEWY